MRECGTANDMYTKENHCFGTDNGKRIDFTYKDNDFYGDIELVNGKTRVSGQDIDAYHVDRDIAIQVFIQAVVDMANGTIELGVQH